MRRALPLIGLLLLTLIAGGRPASAEGSVVLTQPEVLKVPLKVVAIDLKDPYVKLSLALCESFPRGSESFPSMLGRTRPAAAITGTFFDTRTRRPVGDLVQDGNLRYFGGFGVALAISPSNDVSMLKVPRGRHIHWWNTETVVMTGPTLVKDGALALDPHGEGFRSLGLSRRAARAAVGMTKDRRVLFVATGDRITLGKLAQVMAALGCSDAINMDGGTSTALSYGGKVLIAPGRRLVNLLVCNQRIPLEDRFIYPGVPYDWQSLKAAQEEVKRGQQEWSEGRPDQALEHYRNAFMAAPWEQGFRRLYHRCQEHLASRRALADDFLLLGSLLYGQGHRDSAEKLLAKAAALNPGDPSIALKARTLGKSRVELCKDESLARALLKAACPLSDADSVAGMIDLILQKSLSFSPTEDGSLYLQMRKPAGTFQGRLISLDDELSVVLPHGWEAEPEARDGAVFAWQSQGRYLLAMRTFTIPEAFSLFKFSTIYNAHTDLGSISAYLGKKGQAATYFQEYRRTFAGVDAVILSHFIRASRRLYVINLVAAADRRDLLLEEFESIKFDGKSIASPLPGAVDAWLSRNTTPQAGRP